MKESLFIAFLFSFPVKNLKIVTFPYSTIINNSKMIPSISSNYMPEKNMRKLSEHYTIIGTSLWFSAVIYACSLSVLQTKQSHVPSLFLFPQE